MKLTRAERAALLKKSLAGDAAAREKLMDWWLSERA